MAYRMETSHPLPPLAPRMHTIPLPPVERVVHRKAEAAATAPERRRSAASAPNQRIPCMRYNLADAPPAAATESSTLDAVIATRTAATFIVQGTPAFWKVTVQPGATLRDVLAQIHAMLAWPMSYAELDLSSPSFEHRSRVMMQCAQRCATHGEVYKGAESLRRIDWMLGATRVQAIEKVKDIWVVRLAA